MAFKRPQRTPKASENFIPNKPTIPEFTWYSTSIFKPTETVSGVAHKFNHLTLTEKIQSRNNPGKSRKDLTESRRTMEMVFLALANVAWQPRITRLHVANMTPCFIVLPQKTPVIVYNLSRFLSASHFMSSGPYVARLGPQSHCNT